MTEPATLQPHRPADPAVDYDFVGPSEPAPEQARAQGVPPRQVQLAVAQQVHNVVSTLLSATTMLEALPQAALEEHLNEDVADTVAAAAASSRTAYAKALAVEVLIAQAMR